MSCPMSFGELNIPSSRAFWDDCDEDEPSQQTADKLQLQYIAGVECKAMPSDLLLFLEGVNISDFAEKTLLSNASKICDIPSKHSALYHLTSQKRATLVSVIEEDLTNSGEITELLLPYAELAQQVITITIKPKVDYKSENISDVRDEIVFWRGVNSELDYVEPLEPPNFFAGVAAGIASWRDSQKLTVNSYVAYVDNIWLDALVSRPILKLFQEIGLECAASYMAKQKDDSHLYS